MRKLTTLSVLIALFVSFAFVATASAGPGNNIPEPLAVYLNLSRQQYFDVNQILANFYEFSGNRFDRYWQLDQQIWALRIDQTKDPVTIGVQIGNMITEQVGINREVNQHATSAQKSLIGLLNPVQASLLSRLVDAMNLAPLGWDAVSANFLSQPLRGGGSPLPSVGRASVRSSGNANFDLLYEAYRRQHPIAAETPIPDIPISTE